MNTLLDIAYDFCSQRKCARKSLWMVYNICRWANLDPVLPAYPPAFLFPRFVHAKRLCTPSQR